MPDYLEDFDGAPLPDELQPGGVVFEAVEAGLREAPDHFLTATELACIALAPVLAPWLPSMRSVQVRVGDPDPTHSACHATSAAGWACTWLRSQHGKQHVAGDGEVVVAVWDA